MFSHASAKHKSPGAVFVREIHRVTRASGSGPLVKRRHSPPPHPDVSLDRTRAKIEVYRFLAFLAP